MRLVQAAAMFARARERGDPVPIHAVDTQWAGRERTLCGWRHDLSISTLPYEPGTDGNCRKCDARVAALKLDT